VEHIKAGKPLSDFIKLCYAADRPALICGSHGIGKSEMLEQAATALGIGYISRDLSLMEPTDLIGLPITSGKSTIYLPAGFLPKDGKGLLVFEELNRCERYMRAPCLQLLTARTLNDYRLPAGWLPVAAINPPGEEYEVSELDPALLSRFTQVIVVPDRTEWLNWAGQHDLNPAVIRYVENDDSVFDQPESNPRAWKYVSDLLIAAERNSMPRSALRTAVLGQVGIERGTAFLSTLSRIDPPLTADEILRNYNRHQAKVKQWIKNGHVDLLQGSLHAIQLYLQPKADYELAAADTKVRKNLSNFLGDLPGDLQESAKKWFDKRSYEYPKSGDRVSRSSKTRKGGQ